MSSARIDPFEQFVASNGLRIATEELTAYPRDVLAPPCELDRHVLITLTSEANGPGALRSLFVVGATDARPASARDVMWWLSADSWAIERAGSDPHQWAAIYGYPPDDPASLRLMRLHERQALALSTLIGREAYAALLQLYEVELRGSG